MIKYVKCYYLTFVVVDATLLFIADNNLLLFK